MMEGRRRSHHLSVDSEPLALMSDLAMNLVRIINDRTAPVQAEDFSLRAKDVQNFG
jgi:hypothetical protein